MLTLKTCLQFLPLSLRRLSSISMISTKSFLQQCKFVIGLMGAGESRTGCRSSARARSSGFRWAPMDHCWWLRGLWPEYRCSLSCSFSRFVELRYRPQYEYTVVRFRTIYKRYLTSFAKILGNQCQPAIHAIGVVDSRPLT